MNADCLNDSSAIAALRPEWDALWRDIPDACPFLSPAWLLPWWQIWGTGAPRIAVLRGAGSRLDAILPLYRLEDRLLPFGAGVSDRFDVLLRPGLPQETASLLLAIALEANPLPCELTELPADSALRAARPPPGWTDRTTPSSVRPVLDVSAGFDGLPALARRKWRMAAHRADRAGGWTIALADAASLPAAFDTLTALHAMRWQEAGEPGVLADPDVQRFHHAALPRLHRLGVLRLALLYIAGRPAAAAHALLSRGKILFHIGGWDPALAHASPGTLLIGALLQQAADEGRAEADFLRGAEPYKYRWGAVDRPNHHRTLSPP